MELRHLRAFIILTEELHFGRAARRLGIVQSALSRTIQALETHVGVALFHRASRKVTVTPAGEAFLDHARAALRRADDAVRAARLQGEEVGSLRVGLMIGASQPAVGRVLAGFRAAKPGVRVTLVSVSERQLSRTLSEEDVDVVFAWSPVIPAGCRRVRLSSVPLTVQLPTGHHLASRATLSLADLAGEALVLPARSAQPLVHEYYRAQCRAAGFEPEVAIDADTISDVLALVSAGVGVGNSPLPASLRYPGVEVRPQEPALILDYELVWLPGRSRAPWIEVLAGLTREA